MSELPAHFRHGNCDYLGLDIESHKCTLDISDQLLSYAALRRGIHLFAA